MLFADAFAITMTAIGFLLAFPALWLLCLGFWPELVARCEQRTTRMPVRSFLLGVLLTLVTVVVAGVVNQGGAPGAIAATTAICLLIFFAQIGVAGLVTALGKRLGCAIDVEQPWRATLRGGVALELTYLLPILGWFGIMPISWLIGAGAAMMSLLEKRRATAPAMLPAAVVDQRLVADEALVLTRVAVEPVGVGM